MSLKHHYGRWEKSPQQVLSMNPLNTMMEMEKDPQHPK